MDVMAEEGAGALSGWEEGSGSDADEMMYQEGVASLSVSQSPSPTVSPERSAVSLGREGASYTAEAMRNPSAAIRAGVQTALSAEWSQPHSLHTSASQHSVASAAHSAGERAIQR